MDNKESDLIGEPDALGIFKTIYLFLKNHNFTKTSDCFREEWGLDKAEINTITNKSILLTRCKCSKSQANQTEASSMNPNCQHDWLEGTFQGETFQLKPDDTHIFYVCDHCQHHKSKKQIRDHSAEVSSKQVNAYNVDSPRNEAKKLKTKFSQLHNEHQKLIAVTSELTTALQMNIIGQTKNINSVLEQCKSIYPSLFEHEHNTYKKHFNQNMFNDDIQLEATHSDESKETDNVKMNGARASQVNKSLQPQENSVPQLNLDRLSPSSPLMMTPLTPETVRYILDMVFERIFELEKCKSTASNNKSPPLTKEDVEKIVSDVLNEAVKSPSNCGAGEGEYSRPGSAAFKDQNNNFYINYSKLKADLLHGQNEKKIRILQALRWRITKNDGSTREKVMDSYIANDLLDLSTNISIPKRLLLSYDMDHYVQESTCRLINTLASLRQGRDYLTSDERLLKGVLIKKVKDVHTVSGAVIRNMLVASVQKLSIRKQCRTQMVREGLFEIIVDYLDEFYEKLSRYCLEYCSALLMNLCLVDEAKNRSVKDPQKIIGLLRKFLETKNECCLPYINGVMFSVFEKSEIVEEALNNNLDKTIINLIQTTDNENIKKQLDFILQSRLFGKSDPSVRDQDEEGKEEVDLLEAELDQDDFITQLPSGEKLLQEYKAENGMERSQNTVSFSTIRREAPNSAKSFSEETKQFQHKPAAERGIFETAKPRRYSTCSQNLIKNFVRKKTLNQSSGRYPATPLCYMENCQKIQNGFGAQCSCSKCVPGQSRYSCGCYETIRKDIADDTYPNYKTTPDSKNSQLKLPEVAKTAKVADSGDSVDNKPTQLAANKASRKSNNNGGKTGNTQVCRVCGEKKCECAFESRPKLCRTPTL